LTDLLHNLTLGDVLREHTRSRPRGTPAVDGDVRLTYPALDARVNRLARALADVGVGAGDRILWLGQNSYRVLELLLAASKLGALFCPANWRQSAEELAFVVDDFTPQIVVWQGLEIGDAVVAARERVTHSTLWVRHDTDDVDPDGYEAFLARGGRDDDVDVAVDASSGLLVVYTAAFSGRPNGAILSHTACIAQGVVYGSLTGTTGDDVYLNSGPMFHLGTLMHTLAVLVAGGTNVFVRRNDPEELARVIERERCTGAFLVGPMFDGILAVNADGRYDLSSLRSPRGRPEWDAMTSPDQSRWAQSPGGYGQTEGVGMMTYTCLALGALGTHGRTSPWLQIRIVDTDGNEVPPGEVGEIVARGPTVMNGYWNRPEENEYRQRDGWHHTRDLGRREADGSLSFVGPATRMIKSAAENIYPAEVEACIAAHPAVRECAVIGVPDETWVQSVKAIVVRAAGATVTAEEIIEHCRGRIASYKKPRTVEFVDALPRRGYAVDYDALDERFGGGNYPGGHTRSA
jgi:long-chain acyl-CoA synthetase